MKCLNCDRTDIHAKGLCRSCYDSHWQRNNIKKYKDYQKKWAENNKDKITVYTKICYEKNKKYIKDYYRKYYEKNKDQIKLYRKQFDIKNKEHIKIMDTLYRQKNRIQINIYRNKYDKEREKIDIDFKLRNYFRDGIRRRLKEQKSIKIYKTLDLLGCTIQQFREYIEKQFKEGMTWQNYGTEWHLDHIIPCAHFLLTDIEQQKLCFYYTNYQPLWAKENLSKGCKIMEEEILCSIN